MMFANLVKRARTCRRFDESTPIPAGTLRGFVDLARLAPCAGNNQQLRYLIVSKPEDRATLFPNLAWAGVLKDWPGPAEGERPTGYIIILSESNSGADIGIAAQTIQLAATDAGYGACMMGAIKRDAIRKDFHIPEAMNVQLVLAVGKPAETVVIEPMPPDGSTAYWRSGDGVHHVPKRGLEEVLVDYARTTKPNIVYILADDMGYGDLSCLNASSKIHTAHLDRMAAEGMIFTDAHASSAVCTPSRYSILTGRYNWRSRLKQGVLWGYSPHLIEPGRMTVASFLKSHGYHTAMIGKWHLGWDWSTTDGHPAQDDGGNVDFAGPVTQGPDACGFDDYYGHCGSLDMPPYVYVENGSVTAQPDRITGRKEKFTWWREGPTGADFDHEDVLPNFTRRAVRHIETRAATGEPFFLYFPIPAPHTPILPTPEFRGKSGTNPYGDFCLQVDTVVGQLMEALDRAGIADNTILIFTSDNGCSPEADFEELAGSGHNPSHIFRGHKADIYEGGHRIPLLIKWPETIKADSVSDETVCLVDLLATCAELMGAALPDDAGEDSISNLPVWRGGAPDRSLREATIHHSIDGSFSIRKGNWKLEMCAGSGGWSDPRPGKACEGLPPIQLYNLADDIGERTNQVDAHPEVVEALKTLLTRYVKSGRSTPGAPQPNTGGPGWEQLWWI